MDFLEIERRKVDEPINMSNTQFHEYYELYFLIKGDREVFVENKLFFLQSGAFCIIPPFSMHKTEGSAYERINVYISANMLSPAETAFLKKAAEETVFTLTAEQKNFITPILKEAADAEIADAGQRKNYHLYLAKAVLAYLQTQKLSPLAPISSTKYPHKTDSIILQVVAFINENYRDKRHKRNDNRHNERYH